MSSSAKLAMMLRSMPFVELEAFMKAVRAHAGSSLKMSDDEFIRLLVYSAAQVPQAIPDTPEAQMTRKAFGRVRSINIKPQGAGWSMSCNSLPGAAVVGTDLREMFGQLVDTAMAHVALMGTGRK
jgi:hypothetical protein